MSAEIKPLFDVFAERPDRFRMLNSGMQAAGWDRHALELLEIGCSYGDGANYAASTWGHRVTGIDIDPLLIEGAKERHSRPRETGSLSFVCADALSPPFIEAAFDGIYSEAAFSPVVGKPELLRSMRSMLKPGGRVLVNDFCVRSQQDREAWAALDQIPCFAGINTMESYCGAFEAQGFTAISRREDYGEMIRLSLWLSKSYGVPVSEIGPMLSGYFNGGASKCRGVDQGCREEFHRQAHISYCQLVFEKRSS